VTVAASEAWSMLVVCNSARLSSSVRMAENSGVVRGIAGSALAETTRARKMSLLIMINLELFKVRNL